MSRLLTEAGIGCGHEDVFRIQTRDAAATTRPNGKPGDSSTVAAAVLPLGDVTAVHLVRPPLDVIASLVAGQLLTVRYSFYAFVVSHLPQVADYPKGPQRAAAYWLGWNALAAASADVTWRHPITAGDVAALAERCGLQVDPSRVSGAVARVPRNVNSRRHVGVTLTQLGDLAGPVQQAAKTHGVPLKGDE